MRNVLICSYYYYPFNHIATQRAAKMVKYLPEFGWNPLVLCPRWTPENCPAFDPAMVEAFRASPVIGTLPLWRFTEPCRLHRAIRKCTSTADVRVLTTWALEKLHRCLEKSPAEFYYGAIDFLHTLVRSHRIDCLWATAPPQVTHAIADWTSRKHGIPWVADYRDVWDQKRLGTSERRKGYQIRADRRIVASCGAIVTVSDPLKEILQGWHPMPVHVIPNGFDPDDCVDTARPDARIFSVAYTGKIIMPAADPTPLFHAVHKLITGGRVDPSRISLDFYGTESDRKIGRILGHFNGLHEIVRLYDRIGYQESLSVQKRATVLLHLAYPCDKGVLTGKIFEYLGARRPILCVPGDQDCVDALLARTRAGVACRQVDDIAAQVLRWYREWERTGTVAYSGRRQEIMVYSRKNQAGMLASVLDDVSHNGTAKCLPLPGASKREPMRIPNAAAGLLTWGESTSEAPR